MSNHEYGLPGNLANEFRAAPRFNVTSGRLPGELRIAADHKKVSARALNVSDTGLAVISDAYIAAGTICELCGPDPGEVLKLEVVYANLIPGDKRGFRIGLKCRCQGISLAGIFRDLDLI